ncbi:HCLS1-associated protein X-1-like [Amphiura filiformis]|uniref:HCLS1-associated protein X-1-like n=1 Tax=Amphiura filiformis TaxID=82378 RepID=UPI003B223842
MDLNDIFRSFFGFRRTPPNGNDEEFPRGGNEPFGFFGPGFDHHGNDDDDENDNDDGMTGRRGGFGRGSHQSDPFADLERETQQMFRHFEEMFKNFGLSDFHSEPPSIETTPNRRRISPRDEMLKQPDELKESTTRREDHQPESKQDKESPVKFGDAFRSPWQWNIPSLPSASQEDKDLDEQVKDGNLDELLKPKQQQPHPGFFSKGFSKSISIQTIRKPDGTIEQRRTEKDSDGNVTTTVTTSQDDNQTPVLINPTQPRPNQPPSLWSRHHPPDDGGSQEQSLFDKFFGSWSR